MVLASVPLCTAWTLCGERVYVWSQDGKHGWRKWIPGLPWRWVPGTQGGWEVARKVMCGRLASALVPDSR